MKNKQGDVTQTFVKAEDSFLAAYDVAGSIAHVKMLGKQKVLKPGEVNIIVAGLFKILKEIGTSPSTFGRYDEDIHMAVEKRLIQIIGPVGGKMHTGRSRNDQVVLDMKLFTRDAVFECIELITNLQKRIITLAENNIGIIMPGVTHLQPAQAILFAHHVLAYAWMLERDKTRYYQCLYHLDESPLGAAALAGTTYPLDRKAVAHALGFSQVTHNSIDTVSSRDFITEYLSAGAMLMVTLSRMAEDIIIWMSPQYGYVSIGEQYTTGSSIMPQKRNPDHLELIRGKTALVIGNLTAMLSLMKGLPLSYNRDLQDDKTCLFNTYTTVKDSLSVMQGVIGSMKTYPQKMRAACGNGFIEATDLADFLVGQGIPFRQAHGYARKLVDSCIKKGCRITELTDEEYKTLLPAYNKKLKKFIELNTMVNRRNTYGGTSTKSVRHQITELKELTK
ncbi:MAG: argininosuccinate lyase [Elusimicrobiota bacterium]